MSLKLDDTTIYYAKDAVEYYSTEYNTCYNRLTAEISATGHVEFYSYSNFEESKPKGYDFEFSAKLLSLEDFDEHISNFNQQFQNFYKNYMIKKELLEINDEFKI